MFRQAMLASVVSSITLGLLTSIAAPSQANSLVFSGSGIADATTAFNDFNTAVGSVNRIGWDGVRLNGTDINPNTRIIDFDKTVEIPVDRFKGVGAIFADPYAVSGDGFASVNPATTGQFPAFSPNNTFVMFDADGSDGQFNDRFIEQTFVIPNTNVSAGTRAFGAIFLDVEDPTSSSIEYFGTTRDGQKVSLGKFFVPTGASQDPQFLGVVFDSPIITEVQLTVGTNALFSFDGVNLQSFGAEDLNNGIDLANTDDFLFAVPTTAVFVSVPEPTPFSLLSLAFLGAIGYLTKIRTKA